MFCYIGSSTSQKGCVGDILGTLDLDLGQKVGTLDFGGVFWELRIWT